MPRPSKEKRVCRMPKCQEFAALSDGACEKRSDKERQAVGIAMTVEEYECFRLIDYSGLTQEEFAIRSGLGLRFVRELEQGKETVRMDKVNQALAMFNRQAVPGPKEHEGE